MKDFDKVDHRILYELGRNCRISDTRLAKLVRRSKGTVRYKLNKLQNSGAVSGYTIYVNMAKIGNMGYKAYFKIKKMEKTRKMFFDHIKSREDVMWFGTGDGSWDVGVTFFAKNHEDFYAQKNKLFGKFRNIVISQTVGSLVSINDFGNKFLDESAVDPRAEPVIPFGRHDEKSIDSLESNIIGNLLECGRMTLVELTGKCKSNMDTVRKKMKRLEKDGIIVAYVANINPTNIGMGFYKAFLYFEGLSEDVEDRLFKYCKAHPNITAFVRIIAPWDIELEITADDYEKYTLIINDVKREFCDALVNVDFMAMSYSKLYPAREKIFIRK